MNSLAEGGGRRLYESINSFTYNSHEKLSYLDEKIKTAQASIKAHTDNGTKINDQSLKNDYAAIATAYYYKLVKKGGDNVNDAAFNKKLEEIKSSKILDDMVKQDKGGTLFEQATNGKGQNLWGNFFGRFEMLKKKNDPLNAQQTYNTAVKEIGKEKTMIQ